MLIGHSSGTVKIIDNKLSTRLKLSKSLPPLLNSYFGRRPILFLSEKLDGM